MVQALARLLLAPIFLLGGSRTFLHPEVQTPKIAAAGIPEPELAAKVNGASMFLGGLALGLGFMPRVIAALLITALIPTTIVGHAFWKEETEAGRRAQQLQFAKNLGLIGGLLLVLAGNGEKDE